MGSSASKSNNTSVDIEKDMESFADFEVETFSFQSSMGNENESDLSSEEDLGMEEGKS